MTRHGCLIQRDGCLMKRSSHVMRETWLFDYNKQAFDDEKWLFDSMKQAFDKEKRATLYKEMAV